MNISQEDAIWMLTEYDRVRNYGKVSQWIDYHVRTMSLIKNTLVSRPSCSCEFGAYGRMANSMFEQNLEAIKAIAYPPQIEVIDELPKNKTRGRKRSEGDTKK